MIVTSVLGASLSPFAAFAAISDSDPAARESRSQGIQLAQNGDVDIFYDRNGNRVIVDAATGRVIGVEAPDDGRYDQRAARDQGLPDDSYLRGGYPDNGEFRRRTLDELNNGVPLGGDDTYARGAYPEAPPTYGSEPQPLPEERMVRREPLDNSTVGTIESSVGNDGGLTETPPPPPAQGAIVGEPRLGGREDVAALQILLDRVGASPGVIDGRFGSNVDKALVAYRELTGTNLQSTDTKEIEMALAATGGDAFATYEISPEDVAGPYVASVPDDYSQKAQLPAMSFTSVTEALAERFHMDEAYLKALNPEANFNRPGTLIRVANFGRLASTPVTHIIADKGLKQVRAYGADGKLVAAYPATIGSSDTPSPTGTHAVSRIAFNPNYTYNPKINFKQGENDKVLTIPPGPNGPVGSIWIALDKPTYGIHGTPEPSKIGKTESHGCVRLTNFDAFELAKLVKPGVTVDFIE
ncbi:L,D-transpeptidase [Corticibacterium sp. UT-5YL-CI-8]|nr:L,D-transpeptidase [Tianweitania sp. UT-5YL-CI-8]